ncbi:hypothetical protein FKN04_02495 [Bacillus glycinifermentans]|nr:hypothetical protein [Bacillus glycinifermentans]
MVSHYSSSFAVSFNSKLFVKCFTFILCNTSHTFSRLMHFYFCLFCVSAHFLLKLKHFLEMLPFVFIILPKNFTDHSLVSTR